MFNPFSYNKWFNKISSLNKKERKEGWEEEKVFKLSAGAIERILVSLVEEDTIVSLQKAILLFKFFVIKDNKIKKTEKTIFLDCAARAFTSFFNKLYLEIESTENINVRSWTELIDNFPEYFDTFIRYAELQTSNEECPAFTHQKIIFICICFHEIFIRMNNPSYAKASYQLAYFIGSLLQGDISKLYEFLIVSEDIERMYARLALMHGNTFCLDLGLNYKRLRAICIFLQKSSTISFPPLINDFLGEMQDLKEMLEIEKGQNNINVLIQKYTNIAYFLIYREMGSEEKKIFIELSLKLYSIIPRKLEKYPLMIKCFCEYINFINRAITELSEKRKDRGDCAYSIDLSELEMSKKKIIEKSTVVSEKEPTNWKEFIRNWEDKFEFYENIEPEKYIWIKLLADWYKAGTVLESVLKRDEALWEFSRKYEGTFSQNISIFYDMAICYFSENLKTLENDGSQIALQKWAALFECTFLDIFKKRVFDFENKSKLIDSLYPGFEKFSNIFVDQNTDWYSILSNLNLYRKVVTGLTEHYIELIDWSSVIEFIDDGETYIYKVFLQEKRGAILKKLAQKHIDLLKICILLEPMEKNELVSSFLQPFEEKIKKYEKSILFFEEIKEIKDIIELGKKDFLSMQTKESIARSYLIHNIHQLSITLDSLISNDKIDFTFEADGRDKLLRDFITDTASCYVRPGHEDTKIFIAKLREWVEIYSKEPLSNIQARAIAQILLRIYSAFVAINTCSLDFLGLQESKVDQAKSETKKEKEKKRKKRKLEQKSREKEIIRGNRSIGPKAPPRGILDENEKQAPSKTEEKEVKRGVLEGKKEDKKERKKEGKKEEKRARKLSNKQRAALAIRPQSAPLIQPEQAVALTEQIKFYVPPASSVESLIKSLEEARQRSLFCEQFSNLSLNGSDVKESYLKYVQDGGVTIVLPQKIVEFLRRLEEKGSCALIVGGAIRDFLARKEKCDDIDIIADCDEADLSEIFNEVFGEELFDEELEIDDKIPNMRRYLWRKFDITLKPKNFDLLNDADSRDFECNALYVNYQGKIIDPKKVYSRVVLDGCIESIKPAVDEFEKDPIRVLRAIYLHTKTGDLLSQEVIRAIKQISASGKLANLPIFALKSHLCKLFLNKKAVENFEVVEKFSLLPRLFSFVRSREQFEAYWNDNEILKEFIKSELKKKNEECNNHKEILKNFKWNKEVRSELMSLLLLPAQLHQEPIPHYYLAQGFYSQNKLENYIREFEKFKEETKPAAPIVSQFELQHARGRGLNGARGRRAQNRPERHKHCRGKGGAKIS